MASKDQKKEYEPLNSQTDVPPEGEYSLEEILAEYGGGREKLLRDVWGYDYEGGTRTVDVHVQTLRQKLGEGASIVETVRGVGYRVGEGQS